MSNDRALTPPATGPGSTTLAFDLPDGTPTSVLLLRAHGYPSAHIDLFITGEEPFSVNFKALPGELRWYSPVMASLYSANAQTAIRHVGEYFGNDRAHQVALATTLANHYAPPSAGHPSSTDPNCTQVYLASRLAAAAVLTDTLAQSTVALSMVHAGYDGTIPDLLAAARAATEPDNAAAPAHG